MASYSTPRIFSYKATAAITKGRAVMLGADSKHVTIATGPTVGLVGVSQGDAPNAEDTIEVSLQGGGGKGLAGGTIARGDLLTSDANGALVVATVAGSRLVGMAMDAAVAGDLFAIEVINGTLAAV
jgi:hypothetical protein